MPASVSPGEGRGTARPADIKYVRLLKLNERSSLGVSRPVDMQQTFVDCRKGLDQYSPSLFSEEVERKCRIDRNTSGELCKYRQLNNVRVQLRLFEHAVWFCFSSASNCGDGKHCLLRCSPDRLELPNQRKDFSQPNMITCYFADSKSHISWREAPRYFLNDMNC